MSFFSIALFLVQVAESSNPAVSFVMDINIAIHRHPNGATQFETSNSMASFGAKTSPITSTEMKGDSSISRKKKNSNSLLFENLR